jgi:hypothetical protein
VTVEWHLHHRDGVFAVAPPPGDARLDDAAGEELAQRVRRLPPSAAVCLRVHLTPGGPARDDLPPVRAGHFSLALGALVLLVALTLAEAVGRLTSGGVGAVLIEGLTIVGWVALWRPLGLLLFERWAARREVALYRRLERMEIVVVAG